MKKMFATILVLSLMIPAFVLPSNATLIEYRYGDVTKDDSVDILDATQIQFHLANIEKLVGIDLALADFDNDNEASILDATAIQQYLAQLIDDPRGTNNYLEFYAEIKDIIIEPAYTTLLLEGESVRFQAVFDDIYHISDDGTVNVEYTFTGITDPTYSKTYTHISKYVPYVSWSFPSEGLYEVNVKVSKRSHNGSYSYTKRFEVLPVYLFEFDQKRFVDYSDLTNSYLDYPSAPEDAVAVDYEAVWNDIYIHNGNDNGYKNTSERFVALVHTKEEYDKLFGIDNTDYTDEFFENKSLVIAVSPGYDHYDLSPIKGLSMKDDVLYVKVVYGNSYPDPNVAHPTAPTWFSFAAVEKADVENIASVQRVR